MGTNLIDLYSGQPGIADTTLYTCPANTRVRIVAGTVTNDAAVAKWISFHRVPSGGAVGDANIIINSKVIGDKESYTLPEVVGHILEPGDIISSITETAATLTVHLSGIAIT